MKLQLTDSIACIEHGIDKTIDNMNEQYNNHTKFHKDAVIKGDIHTSFSDNNGIAKRLLGLHVLRNSGFNGPMDYDNIVTKSEFAEKFVSFGQNVTDILINIKNAYYPTDIDIFKSNKTSELLRGVNAVIYPLYGVTIRLVDKNTKSGKNSLCLISKVPTIFHINADMYRTYNLKKSLESTWETNDSKIKDMFINDIHSTMKQWDNNMSDTKKWLSAHSNIMKTKELKKNSNVIDIDDWISSHIVKSDDKSSYVKCSDIKNAIGTKSSCVNEKTLYSKLKQIQGFHDQKKINGKNIRNVITGYTLIN